MARGDRLHVAPPGISDTTSVSAAVPGLLVTAAGDPTGATGVLQATGVNADPSPVVPPAAPSTAAPRSHLFLTMPSPRRGMGSGQMLSAVTAAGEQAQLPVLLAVAQPSYGVPPLALYLAM